MLSRPNPRLVCPWADSMVQDAEDAMVIIMTKLELVIVLRKIAALEGCHLTLRAASKIADWLKDGKAYDITSWIKKDGRL